MTISSRVCKVSLPSVVSSPMTSLSRWASRSSSYLVPEAAQQPRLVEHLAAAVEVEAPDLRHAHPQGDAGRDDRSRAGAADVVELVGEPEVLPSALPQRVLDGREDLHRHQAADAAPVEREQLALLLRSQLLLDRHPGSFSRWRVIVPPSAPASNGRSADVDLLVQHEHDRPADRHGATAGLRFGTGGPVRAFIIRPFGARTESTSTASSAS
jgi:hypothetical protein